MKHNTCLMSAEGDDFAPVSVFFVIDAPVSSSNEVKYGIYRLVKLYKKTDT